MYDTLVKQLKQAHADGKEIYLTGHSLGGSLTSVLATVLLERCGPISLRIILHQPPQPTGLVGGW